MAHKTDEFCFVHCVERSRRRLHREYTTSVLLLSGIPLGQTPRTEAPHPRVRRERP